MKDFLKPKKSELSMPQDFKFKKGTGVKEIIYTYKYKEDRLISMEVSYDSSGGCGGGGSGRGITVKSEDANERD